MRQQTLIKINDKVIDLMRLSKESMIRDFGMYINIYYLYTSIKPLNNKEEIRLPLFMVMNYNELSEMKIDYSYFDFNKLYTGKIKRYFLIRGKVEDGSEKIAIYKISYRVDKKLKKIKYDIDFVRFVNNMEKIVGKVILYEETANIKNEKEFNLEFDCLNDITIDMMIVPEILVSLEDKILKLDKKDKVQRKELYKLLIMKSTLLNDMISSLLYE